MVQQVPLPTYETLLTEAIRSLAVDSGITSGPVAAGSNGLPDITKNWAVNIHRNRLVKIVRGSGSGQLAVIDSNSANGLIVKGSWARVIATGAVYVILNADYMQMLRDVFGGGLDISVTNPLETHDPKVEDIEDKLDHPIHGLAALKAVITSLAGGAFYGSYGSKNVEVDNDVDFGIILYNPSGNIITIGEITPGTYTVRRVRGAVDTEIVAPTASSEVAGRVYMTYSFPAVSWQVGDIFYITFSGIVVIIDGVTTEYPNLFIWGRVVREADISAKIDAVEVKLDNLGAFTAVENLKAILGAYTAVSNLKAAIDTITGYIDTEIADILADTDALETRLTALRAGYLDNINNADLANIIQDIAQATGTFAFDESAAGEQTAFSVVVAARAKVGAIWLDFNNLTMDCTIRIKHKIDGATYRTFGTYSWVFATDDKGVLLEGFTAYRDFQITMQCAGGGVAGKNVPYAIV